MRFGSLECGCWWVLVLVVLLSSDGLAGLSGTPILLKQRRHGFKSLSSMANKRDIFAPVTVIQMPDVALFTDR